jgi:hypothetical protein
MGVVSQPLSTKHFSIADVSPIMLVLCLASHSQLKPWVPGLTLGSLS